MNLDAAVMAVTRRIAERSAERRAAYLEHIQMARRDGVARSGLAFGNLVHSFAACAPRDKVMSTAVVLSHGTFDAEKGAGLFS